MTHAELCLLAVRWLYGAGKCKFVARECRQTAGEQPDAFGFRWWNDTVLVECKASRADFLKDAKKPSRTFEATATDEAKAEMEWALGIGRERYYLCPKDLIKPEEVPQGWGLLYAYPSGVVRRVKPATPFERWNEQAERYMTFKLLARAAQTGRWHQIEAGWMEVVPNEAQSLPEPLYDTQEFL